MKETKQVIVMRKDLNMRKGKMVAQGAHASLGIFTSYYFNNKKIPEPIQKWLESSFKKVCVGVDSEEELLKVYMSVPKEIPAILITDAGTTEFGGIPTKTCIAVGPWWSEDIDKITGELKLL